MKRAYPAAIVFCLALLFLAGAKSAEAYYTTELPRAIWTLPSNCTEGWIGSYLTQDSAGAYCGATITGTGAAKRAWRDSKEILFGKPFNSTYLGYLGANFVWMNFSLASKQTSADNQYKDYFPICGPDNCAGSAIGAYFRERTAPNDEITMIGYSAAADITQTGYQWQDGAYYNFSYKTNYTSGWTNLSRMLATDSSVGVHIGAQNGVIQIASSMFNLSVIGLRQGAVNDYIKVKDVIIYANMDADYFKKYTLKPEHNSALTRNDTSILVNISAPITMNVTIKVNNGTAQVFCANCNVSEQAITADVASGFNVLLFNYTFIKSGEMFSKVESYNTTIFNNFAMCGTQIGVNSVVMDAAFKDEMGPGNYVPSNYTFTLYDSDGGIIISNSSGAVTSFKVCGSSSTTPEDVRIGLAYQSVNETFVLRQLNIPKANLNITAPLNITAWQLQDIQAGNYVTTIEESSGIALSGYYVLAKKLSGITSLLQLVTGYISDANAGQAVHPLDLTTIGAQHNFLVYDINKNLVKETGFHVLSTSGETIKISLAVDDIISIDRKLKDNLDYSFFFDGSNKFSLAWTNASSLINLACLDVNNFALNDTEFFKEEVCLSVNQTAPSGAINITLPFVNMTYIGRFIGKSVDDGINHLIDIKNAIYDLPKISDKIGADGLVFLIIILLIAAIIGSHDLRAAIVFFVAIFDFAWLFGFIDLGARYMWIVTIAGIALLWGLEKMED